MVYETDQDYDKSEKERVGKINIMIFEVNIDKLFREIEEKVIEEQRNIEEKIEYEKEDKSLESPEDAKETQEVHEPTSKETEESHGGDEASKEIKDSS